MVPNKKSRASLGLSVLCGALLFLGFAGFDQFYLEWFAFVPLLMAIRGASGRRALVLGWIAGFVACVGGFYWVAHMLHAFADLGWALSVLGLVLLCAYMGLGFGLVCWFIARCTERIQLAPVWSLTVAFSAHEFAFPQLFPFYLGASQYKFLAITQIAELFGPVGISFLLAAVNGAIFEAYLAWVERRRVVVVRVATPAALFISALVYGAIRISAVDALVREAPTMTVAIVQTNLGARDKAEMSSEFIRRHVKMSKEAIAAHPEIDLVVWPESAFNRWIPRTTKNTKRMLTEGIDRPVLFGALTFEPSKDSADARAFNSAVLTSSAGDVLGIFDKVILLAFGERIPLEDMFPSLRRVFSRGGGFTAGENLVALTMQDGTRILPLICYEDILPEFVRRLWNQAGAAHVLVNVTNDSWYGDSHEPIQHLVLASLRSIETRRALIRSTNTGISAVIDPVGRVTHRTGQWTQETLVADVPLISDGTPTVFLKLGNTLRWFTLLAFAFVLVATLRSPRAMV